jgi:hypothetical protein
MDDKIHSILDVESHEPGHHFGRPFLTPYQIAIAFRERYPEEFRQIGKPLGGRGAGQHDSLAQYIALELSRGIRANRLMNIEGRFLHRLYLKTLQYEDAGGPIESSLMRDFDLSMFRRLD